MRFLQRQSDTTTQEDTDNYVGLPIKETESIINNLPEQQAPGPDGPTDDLHQTPGEELLPVLHRCIQKPEAEWTQANTFQGVSTRSTPAPGEEDTTRKEKHIPISLMNIFTKILKKSANQIKQCARAICTMNKWGFSHMGQAGLPSECL